jgi:hypothetical protein
MGDPIYNVPEYIHYNEVDIADLEYLRKMTGAFPNCSLHMLQFRIQ